MTFLIFFIIISVLILSHELGHFLAAKKTNTKVLEFGFGFPPKILKWKKGETEYTLNLFPIGGFVKILGEDGTENNGQINKEKERNFYFKPSWVKALILAAGVSFNLILAWILISVSLFAGSFKEVSDTENIPISENPKVVITDVLKNSPAEKTGILPGDILSEIQSAAGESVKIFKAQDAQDFINKNKGGEVKVVLDRNGDLKILGAKLQNIENGALGIAMARVAIRREPLRTAFFTGFTQTVDITKETAVSIFYFILGILKGAGVSEVTGPVGIFNIVGAASRFGVSYLMRLAAILSINLAIINFLPFPALDGGRLMFVIIEKIRNKPLNQKFVNAANLVGFMLLILLMVIVSVRDVMRFL